MTDLAVDLQRPSTVENVMSNLQKQAVNSYKVRGRPYTHTSSPESYLGGMAWEFPHGLSSTPNIFSMLAYNEFIAIFSGIGWS